MSGELYTLQLSSLLWMGNKVEQLMVGGDLLLRIWTDCEKPIPFFSPLWAYFLEADEIIVTEKLQVWHKEDVANNVTFSCFVQIHFPKPVHWPIPRYKKVEYFRWEGWIAISRNSFLWNRSRLHILGISRAVPLVIYTEDWASHEARWLV